MSSWSELLERPERARHVVHLFGEDDRLLARNVSRYLGEGLRRGDGLLVIATAEHKEAITRQLREDGPDPAPAFRAGRFVLCDAEATLARFLVDGQPDWELFEQVVGDAVRQVHARATSGRLRAFGEMVGLLWARGRRDAAIHLEEHWNRLLESHDCTLFCAYPIDVFDERFEPASLAELLLTHTHALIGPGTLLSGAGPRD